MTSSLNSGGPYEVVVDGPNAIWIALPNTADPGIDSNPATAGWVQFVGSSNILRGTFKITQGETLYEHKTEASPYVKDVSVTDATQMMEFNSDHMGILMLAKFCSTTAVTTAASSTARGKYSMPMVRGTGKKKWAFLIDLPSTEMPGGIMRYWWPFCYFDANIAYAFSIATASFYPVKIMALQSQAFNYSQSLGTVHEQTDPTT